MSAQIATPFSTGAGCVTSLVAACVYVLILNGTFAVVSLIIGRFLPGPWPSLAWLWVNVLAALPLTWLAWQAGTRQSAAAMASQALRRYEASLALITAGVAGQNETSATLAITTQSKARQALAAAEQLRRGAHLSPADEVQFQTMTRQFLDQLSTISGMSYGQIDLAMNDYLAAVARLVAR